VEAGADSWPDPKVTVKANDDSQILIRIIPGESIGDVYGFEGLPKGKYAKAEWFHLKENQYQRYQTKDLMNPVAPVVVEVTNVGGLVTLDNWHNVGIGYIAVIYSETGSVIKKYKLDDIYKKEEIEKMDRSSSSVWWRCRKTAPMVWEKAVSVIDAFGGLVQFQTDTGAVKYQSGFSTCE
jgi:hypothetical protein